ncbi:MAG: SDR family NAD(P)-dependent oxidoreductase [Phycisphaeraceae bacterium]|nr:SDR family NAD(P)-dependent oxidoreductase [Phycisphaeraceae bacterium]
MAIDLAGKPIAITGASSGIGAATALACAAAGMPVALAARREDRLRELVNRIEAAGGRAIAVACDVDEPKDSQRLVEETVGAFGSVYSVCANAGYGFESRVLDMTAERIEAIFRTNFYGTMHLVWAAGPRMVEAGAGHILMCSSCLSKLAVPMYAAYSASKAMQDHFGRALRLELAGTGVFCSTVHPVQTRTEFSDRTRAESRGKAVMTGSGGSSQTPETVASAIVRCLRKPRGEVWTSVGTRLSFALATAWPGLADRVIAKEWKRRAEKR